MYNFFTKDVEYMYACMHVVEVMVSGFLDAFYLMPTLD